MGGGMGEMKERVRVGAVGLRFIISNNSVCTVYAQIILR
jgi:hypothetical protein